MQINGNEARKYIDEIARLRIQVFFEYPYLYQGTIDYEKKYLETYFQSKNATIILIKDGELVVGASTGILASEADSDFREPFLKVGIDTSSVFYFGESVLLPSYRGNGIGKKFFQLREEFARSLKGVKHLAFCAVIRSSDHPLRPGHVPLDDFWKSQGFVLKKDLIASFAWKDRLDERESIKKMQFWMKTI